jgi:hypothetical protein
MKRVMNFLMSGAIALGTQLATAQSADESRMNRDIEVAENVLSTLIKQEFEKSSFFPVEIRGSYRVGHGITFTVPTDMIIPMMWGGGRNDVMILDGSPGVYSYSFSSTPEPELIEEEMLARQEQEIAEMERSKAEMKKATSEKEKGKAGIEKEKAEKEAKPRKTYERVAVGGVQGARGPKVMRTINDSDSLQKAASEKVILASKNFLADYGDLLSQVKPEERIIITNKSDNSRWYYRQNEKRSLLSVEVLKSDLTQFRQGKITREQLMAKIKVTNTETSGKVEQDLELLASIFGRLYRSDLSKSFFVEGNPYYERLTDYGAVVYMQVYSSNQIDEGLFSMPTVDLREVDQAGRDKKVKELYPVFVSELKENILDYGRTLKSLKDNERLVFNVVLTKCKGCGIPADIELSVQNSVLKDYSAGKIDKNSAAEKITVKKGADQ